MEVTNPDLIELIALCDRLCHRLGEMAAQEEKFCVDLCQAFDMMSWESYKMSNDIRFVSERYL